MYQTNSSFSEIFGIFKRCGLFTLCKYKMLEPDELKLYFENYQMMHSAAITEYKQSVIFIEICV